VEDMMAEQKFEEAIKRLEEIVQDLEEGELPLEESLKIFEEGMKLIKLCSGKLEEAEKKVTLLVQESGGKYTQVPFEPEAEGDGNDTGLDKKGSDS
jgi:exodeoxyribonuclease VII small subunit